MMLSVLSGFFFGIRMVQNSKKSACVVHFMHYNLAMHTKL